MSVALFLVLAALTVASSLLVVLHRNPVYSALGLVATLFLLAVLFLGLDAQMVAALQIIVYAGAIMVLFLFVIMLLDPFSAALLRDKKKSLIGAGVAMGILALALLVPFLMSYKPSLAPRNPDVAGGAGTAENIGHLLFNEYLLPFEMTSVLILVAIIGVVVLAKRRP